MATAYDASSVSAANFNRAYQFEQTAPPQAISHGFNILTDMGGASGATGDSIKLIPIAGAIGIPEAAQWVMGVYLKTIVASTTGSSVISVGDVESATQYLSASSATAAAGTVALAAASTWKPYFAADYIIATLGTTPPLNGIFSVGALIATIPAQSGF